MASIEDGIFELYPMVAKPGSLALDICANGTTNGTNVMIWGVHGGNNQKFYITEEDTNKWSIRAIESGKYVDIAGAVADYGTNVFIWEDNDQRQQRWKLTKIGDKMVNGVECVVVTIGSYVTSDANTWMLDVYGARTEWATNVWIWENNGNDAQKWILVPTTAEDPTMPVPYNLGIVKTTGSKVMEQYIPEDTPFYPSWTCSPSWVNGGENYYEMRHRLRYMKSGSGGWQDWGNWSAWSNANCTMATDGSRQNWATSPMEVEYLWANVKNAELEFQLRCAATGNQDEDPCHSQAASRTLNVYKKPSVAVTGAGWSPEGLRIGWSSDYTYGTTYLTVKKIMFDGVVAYNNPNGYVLQGMGATGSGLIPADILRKWPQNSQTLSVTYDVGYDQATQLSSPNTNTYTVSFDAGTTTVEPVFVNSGAKLIAVVADLGTTRMWIAYEDKLIECWEDPAYTVTSGYKAFDIPYPMRKAFNVYTSTHNAAGTSWANDITEHDPVNRYANAWTWKGGSAYLIYSPERPSISTTYNPVYSAEVLDGREHEAVQFSGTVKVSKDVSGDLMPNDTSTVEDFEALLAAGHALFRSMNGEIFDAAITAVSTTEVNNSYTEVSVSMIIESV